MKIGRNDSCPCGSGKKYKKCCLPKDELEAVAARKAQQTTVAAAKSTTRPPVHLGESEDGPSAIETTDVPESAIDRCWKEFEAADYEQRIQLYIPTNIGRTGGDG